MSMHIRVNVRFYIKPRNSHISTTQHMLYFTPPCRHVVTSSLVMIAGFSVILHCLLISIREMSFINENHSVLPTTLNPFGPKSLARKSAFAILFNINFNQHAHPPLNNRTWFLALRSACFFRIRLIYKYAHTHTLMAALVIFCRRYPQGLPSLASDDRQYESHFLPLFSFL